MEYETRIGLEVHIELDTDTKIFCSCKTDFGNDFNSNICPVCTGQPGVLPTLNKKVVEYAIRLGTLLNCEITRLNKFDRKNYFYPDLPKAYQISQLYLPVCHSGFAEINGRKIRIKEIHMEEDAGKLIHNAGDTFIDYNRCGIPLLEIVTEPDFVNNDEVIFFLENLRQMAIYAGITKGRMEEGNMRADVNVSVNKKGDELGKRREIKNMSSFKAIHKAISYESDIQRQILEKGEKVEQLTCRWDEEKEISIPMRSKEDSMDYRYFPEPDIPPIFLEESFINSVIQNMPESIEKKKKRYMDEYKLSQYDTDVLTSQRAVSQLFEKVIDVCNNPKEAANMIMGEYMRLLSSEKVDAENKKIDAHKTGEIINLVLKGKISRGVAKTVFEEVFKNNVSVNDYITENNLIIVEDENLVRNVVRKVIEDNPQSLSDYKNGKAKAFGFLVGQSMKELKGKAQGNLVNKILKEEIENI